MAKLLNQNSACYRHIGFGVERKTSKTCFNNDSELTLTRPAVYKMRLSFPSELPVKNPAAVSTNCFLIFSPVSGHFSVETSALER